MLSLTLHCFQMQIGKIHEKCSCTMIPSNSSYKTYFKLVQPVEGYIPRDNDNNELNIGVNDVFLSVNIVI